VKEGQSVIQKALKKLKMLSKKYDKLLDKREPNWRKYLDQFNNHSIADLKNERHDFRAKAPANNHPQKSYFDTMLTTSSSATG